jgi:hypothetical protein
MAADEVVGFSETALRASASAGSVAKDICAETSKNRSNERKRSVEFIGNLQTTELRL